MKRFIALTVVLTGVVGLAIAFAGPEPLSSKEIRPMQPACDWSGFYIGVNGGVGSYTGYNTDNNEWEVDPVTQTMTDINGIFGGQIGYNFQTGAAVFGIEADGDWTNFSARSHLDNNLWGDTFNRTSEMDFMGTVRGRVGLAYQNVMAYVTAGVAFATGDRRTRYDEDVPAEQEEFANWNSNGFRAGPVAGVGVEYMAGCHWTIRLETLYADFGEDTVHPSSFDTGSSAADYTYTFSDKVWVARVGVNYKFGSFGR